MAIQQHEIVSFTMRIRTKLLFTQLFTCLLYPQCNQGHLMPSCLPDIISSELLRQDPQFAKTYGCRARSHGMRLHEDDRHGRDESSPMKLEESGLSFLS